jgi:hypothetical protein
VIRQAISCDICGSEKRQTNHWFVAYDQGGELRVAGWSSRNRLRPGSKHLCGQTCLHKLVDEFMAKAISGRATIGADEPELVDHVADRVLDRSAAAAADRYAVSDGYIAAGPLVDDGESSARLIKPAAAAAPTALRPWPSRVHPELVPPTGRPQTSPSPGQPSGPRPDPLGSPAAAAAPDSAPRFSSRQWRTEAWDRERNRELRNGNTDSAITARRRAGS